MNARPLDEEYRSRHDKKMLKIFAVVTIAIFALVFPANLASKMPILDALGSAFVAGLALSLYVWGIVDFLKMRKSGMLSRRRTWQLLLASSVVLTAILMLVLAFLLNNPISEIDLGMPPASEFSPATVAGIVVGLFFSSFLSIALLSLLAFGGIALVSALTRIMTPAVLWRVRNISGKGGLTDWALAWIFGIPDTLDTRTLHLGPVEDQAGFPQRRFTQAVMWEMVLGVILAVYVAFNPLVVDRSTGAMLQLFTTLATAAVFIPLIMVPWFVYTSINAAIKGMTKDFRLFDGIKSRIFRSYIAVGTIVVFIRISLSEAEAQTYLLGLGFYLSTLALTALMFTFVYFNYFDKDLTHDVVAGYDKMAR